RGAMLAIRRLVLLLTSILLAYTARVAIGVYQLVGTSPSLLTNPDQIQQVLLLPKEVFNPRTPLWLYAIVLLFAAALVRACAWAAEDKLRESRVERARELEGMIDRLPEELDLESRHVTDLAKLVHLRAPYLNHTMHVWETYESPLLPPEVELSHIAV